MTVGTNSIKAPKIIRTGMPDIEAFNCAPYPKWIVDVTGKRILVQTPAEEALIQAAIEKAEAPAKK